ncbi:bifunctional cytidylyltransferase/SDR family oxidoreductase [Sphingobacteriaceae bacterium WQ 2009]|uniref:Bifunctional cytidylyltransferase/SDR family oxidoreductase n=1 Tax=Rhinopithecimicrobium faecis TaxID=2820698 RepID=A0A8T4HBI0_9SPHI|nr:bifunctional cytidylyltransferase/SDR family oxidoreductase [Sphingobacteriaceae bacterium WQ 2009]
MNIAVILAGGSGTRLGNSMPKQFLKIAGKAIIEHTIDVFENNDQIDEIVIVSKSDYLSTIEQLIVKNKYQKVKKILQGGKERYHSSLAAIEAYNNIDCNLIFHDSVRPLVNNRIIDDCIQALQNYDAVDVAIQATDTIVKVNQQDCITDIPLRSELRNGQTPQCFKREVIQKAYEIALADPDFTTTDDCNVIKKYLPNTPIYVVKGEIFNMKVTYLEDLFLIDKLFQLKTTAGSSLSLTKDTIETIPNKVMVVFGGSYGIGKEIVDLARKLGAIVYSYSRSENGVDISNEESVRKALAEVKERNGRIDYVISSAGILVKEALFSMSYSDIISSININLLGSFIVAKESHQYLTETSGSLLFYTSSSYTKGRMMYSVYSATKAAIVNLVQALSEEWFDDYVRVNCINPERTKTPMRIKNFGHEPEDTLLDPVNVAIASLNALVSKQTGDIIDVRK